MAKLFFTSATGYIGLAAARAAKDAGHEVAAIARSDEAAVTLEKYGIKIQLGDIRKPETYRDVLKHYDVVIHTAAAQENDAPRVEEQVVNTVIEALRNTQKAFIYTSGTWVLGNTGEHPANEQSSPRPIPLVAWRPAFEKQVLAAADYGIRTVVVRPGLVYGNKGGFLGRLAAYAKENGYVPYIGDGENRWSLVHLEDVARLYVLAAEKASAGVVLHATDNQPIKQREVAELVARALELDGKVRSYTVEQAGATFAGAYATGLALDQAAESPASHSLLNWHPSAPSLVDELLGKARQLVGGRR